MFSLYFIFPLIWLALSAIPCVRRDGIKAYLKKGSTWVWLLATEVFTALFLMLIFLDFAAPISFAWLKLPVAAMGSLLFVIIRDGVIKIRQGMRWYRALIFCLLVAVFLEGTVFNFRFYQTHSYQAVNVTEDCHVSIGFEETGKAENEYTLNSVGSPYLELKDTGMKIYNIYVNIIAKDSSGEVVNAYVDIYMTDESNANYFKLPTQMVMGEVESTKYLHVLTNGVTDDLKLNISTNYAKTFQIEEISLNVPQPMRFSLLRLLGVAVLLFIFWILRPTGACFSHLFSDSLRQRTITVAVVSLEIVLLLTITIFNPAFSGNPSRHTAQYQELAESLLDGQLYLKEEPPAYLAEMENPYDKTERDQQKNLTGESYYWDAAYFEGKYYVYFGVLPVLMLYLPYQLLIGEAMPNVMAIQFYLCLFVIGSFLLIGRIIKKYFSQRGVPYLSYLILSLIFVNAAGGIFIAKRPDFYSVPIISALALTVFGLYFWMKAEDGGRVQPVLAGLGSLCMALVAGCRPQLLLCSALIFVIYWRAVFKDRTLFSKKGWQATVALILPYLIVAAGIMWYNAARFGSPFDFGANYNLTTNDMTGRGYRVERVGLSIFTYFFQFPNFTGAFPFLQSSTISTNYLGTTITEPMFGGIFVVIPLLWVLVLLPSQGKGMYRKGLLGFCLVPMILSLIIGAFDAQGAGLLQRYVSDFAFLACLGAIFMTCYLYDRSLMSRKKQLNGFLRFALYASGAYCFLCIFAKYSVEIFYRNPYLFNFVSELVQFW